MKQAFGVCGLLAILWGCSEGSSGLSASDPTATIDQPATGGQIDPTISATGGQPTTPATGGTIATATGGIGGSIGVGGAGGGAGGTWSENWTTIAFRNGQAGPFASPSRPPNGYGWVDPAPAATLFSPVCDGAPITASLPCSHTPDWSSARELCISGSIPADNRGDGPENWGVMVGLNVTEPFGGGLGAAYVRTFVNLTGSPSQGLRLVVHRSGDPDGTTYCVPVTNIERIVFTSFNTKCWDRSGIALRPEDVPNIDWIALHVPPTSSPISIDNLCLSSLYLQ